MRKVAKSFIIALLVMVSLSTHVFAYPEAGTPCDISGYVHEGSGWTFVHESHEGTYNTHHILSTSKCIHCGNTIQLTQSTHCKPSQCFYYSVN